MSKVLSSVCMIECGGSGATGFLVSVGEEIAFMTAGHVFSDKKREDKYGERVLLPNIDWSQYNLYFCCVDGDKNGSQVVHRTLADFNQMFTLRGSIAYMGTRRTFPGRVRATSKDITVESNLDFCVLVLDNPDAKETLKDLKLSWLQCGQGDYLKSSATQEKGLQRICSGRSGCLMERRRSLQLLVPIFFTTTTTPYQGTLAPQ